VGKVFEVAEAQKAGRHTGHHGSGFYGLAPHGHRAARARAARPG
jgi:hypothetical protein